MRKLLCSLIVVCFLAIPAFAQTQPTVMDLIQQVQANNAILKGATDANTAEIKALRADLAAEKAARQADSDKINQIYVAIVRNPSLLPPPPAAVVVAPAKQVLSVQTPRQQVMFSDGGGMQMSGGGCSSGSCGSGGGLRVMRFRRSDRAAAPLSGAH
jgi:hypothetical protein